MRRGDTGLRVGIPFFISYARKPQALSLGMNGILSNQSQVKPGEAEQIPT
jgi:hypothetical protein